MQMNIRLIRLHYYMKHVQMAHFDLVYVFVGILLFITDCQLIDSSDVLISVYKFPICLNVRIKTLYLLLHPNTMLKIVK